MHKTLHVLYLLQMYTAPRIAWWWLFDSRVALLQNFHPGRVVKPHTARTTTACMQKSSNTTSPTSLVLEKAKAVDHGAIIACLPNMAVFCSSSTSMGTSQPDALKKLGCGHCNLLCGGLLLLFSKVWSLQHCEWVVLASSRLVTPTTTCYQHSSARYCVQQHPPSPRLHPTGLLLIRSVL